MPDTMTATKTVGALCGALLVLLLSQWVATSIYHVGDAGHGGAHGGSKIFAELEAAHDTVDHGAAEAVDFTLLLAEADPEKGKKVFAKCKACHKADEETNGVGPHLVSLIDRPVGAIAGFSYSSPMAALGGVWDINRIAEFLDNPKKSVPGTKMSFAGLKKDKDKANLISYLLSLQE